MAVCNDVTKLKGTKLKEGLIGLLLPTTWSLFSIGHSQQVPFIDRLTHTININRLRLIKILILWGTNESTATFDVGGRSLLSHSTWDHNLHSEWLNWIQTAEISSAKFHQHVDLSMKRLRCLWLLHWSQEIFNDEIKKILTFPACILAGEVISFNVQTWMEMNTKHKHKPFNEQMRVLQY